MSQKVVDPNTGEIDFIDDPVQDNSLQPELQNNPSPVIPGAGEDPYSMGGSGYTTPAATPSFRQSENASMDALNAQSSGVPNANFRQSENASMDAYNSQQQGPPVPSPSQGSRDSNNADTTGTTGGNAGGTNVNSGEGQAGSGSSAYNNSSNYNENPVGNTGYTNSGMNGSGSSSMGRIIAGLQQSNNPNLSSDGYNPAKYASARKNPLNAYVSFNCLYTLSCMSKTQQNNATKLSKSGLQNIICRTSGDWDKPNSHVATEFGQYDYIIDDLIVASIPSMSGSTGAAFATKITFRVTEPYSLGLFFLALQDGSKKGGYGNFREAPYILMIEFLGYRDDGKPFIDNNLTRFIPMKFISIKLKAGMAGSVYDCEAVPYNEIAFRDPFVTLDTKAKLEANSVESALTGGAASLKSMLKEMTENRKKAGTVDVLDEYDIQFPKDFTEKVGSGNIISKSGIFKGFDDAGQVPFPAGNPIFDKVKQLYKNSPINLKTDKTFNFKENTKITDIITEVVLRSDYVIKQLLDGSTLTNPLGMIHWFRIETRVEDLAESNAQGRQARKFIYRVVPYDVSVSRLVPTNSQPPGYQALNASVTRVYEYLYTGQNTDIIRLDLEFNMAFYTALPSDATDRTGTNTSALVPNANKDTKESFKPGGDTRDRSAGDAVGSAALTAAPNTQVNQYGGSGSDDDKSMQAKTLQALLTNQGDLVELEIEVRGDPYYLPSSGMGNLIGDPETFNVMKDQSMNYQSGETDFAIVLRTPVDLDPKTGLYRFAKTVDELSGLFMITEVESKFNHNRFTQVIKGIRRRVQLGSGTGTRSVLFG
jgi:hypothetical protein